MFDNADHRAGGQWGQFAEIAVKRVLTRDGTSSYYINNQPVRRRDVQDVFLGTGLGPRAYAIIGQGTISRIIESKPEELRLFLEEAAGVSKYKERRRETENRLSRHAREPDPRRGHPARAQRQPRQAGEAGRGRRSATTRCRPTPRCKQHQLWFLKRAESEADQARSRPMPTRPSTTSKRRMADLRHIEAELETVRQAHYAAGDQVNQAQGQLYEASAEVGRLEARDPLRGRRPAARRAAPGPAEASRSRSGPRARKTPRPRSRRLAGAGRRRRGAGRAAGRAGRGAGRAAARPRRGAARRRRPRPTRSAPAWRRCSSRSRCWPPTSATSRSSRAS